MTTTDTGDIDGLYCYLETHAERSVLMLSREGVLRVTVSLTPKQRRALAQLLLHEPVTLPLAIEEVVA